ncbi:MAG: DUF2167 domain-containing protein [Desulfuromonadales bacterium]|nr:DUF2167 domain-containing protein [Desulfuromonadales bacterium]
MKRILLLVMMMTLTFTCNVLAAEDISLPSVNWQKGPATASIGDYAQLKFGENYMFADGNDTRRVLEAFHNIPSGDELGLIATKDLDYFAVFTFDDVGYVKDDEKDSLDADKILEQLKKGQEEENQERAKKGYHTLQITGWEIPPRYNPTTHNLEWAIRIVNNEGGESINFRTKYLGRKGVMNVILVAEPKEFNQVLPKFNELMQGFTFNQGQKYSEFVKGDKVAKYGLAALITGGLAAAAIKSGLFSGLLVGLAKLWKLLIVAVVAVGAAIKGFFAKLFGRKKQ